MYEEYLEDYFYKLMAKIASRVCRFLNINSNNRRSKITQIRNVSKFNLSTDLTENNRSNEDNHHEDLIEDVKENTNIESNSDTTKEPVVENKCDDGNRTKSDDSVDEELNKLNFHMMLFFMWLCVTLVNVPALLTWARNFKYVETCIFFK